MQCSDSTTLLLSECDNIRPGFALLRLLTKTNNKFVAASSAKYNGSLYLSSEVWRNIFITRKQTQSTHGPCTTCTLGNMEYDWAFCLKSHLWPDAALNCLGRLHRAAWSSHEALSSIINEGCLFVPIGLKNSPNEGFEWRISFSLAEKKLINNMTHTQFLTYGLLKIFLKEAIDVHPEIKGLLCSYFLKTILFWKIIEEESWDERNFLHNFWKCFQTLMEYVVAGHCPNFFIPDNNMFRGKIKGDARKRLLSHLTSLYRTGYRCLLECPSVRDVMLQIFQEPMTALRLPSDQSIPRKTNLDTDFILETWNGRLTLDKEQRVNLGYLLHAQFLLDNSFSEYESVVLQTWIRILSSQLCVKFAKQNSANSAIFNKIHYKSKHMVIKVLKSSSCECAHNLIFLAVALFHFGDVTTAIKVLHEVKKRLQHPLLMFPWNLYNDKYQAAGGETTPISKMMKTVVAYPLVFQTSLCIPGLELEHEAAERYFTDEIIIPPLVCTQFLLYLCYRKEHSNDQASAVLEEFSTLVHSDERNHIHDVYRAISWQLLGICQEMDGDYQEALSSYNKAMQQTWCNIGYASEQRIRHIRSHLECD